MSVAHGHYVTTPENLLTTIANLAMALSTERMEQCTPLTNGRGLMAIAGNVLFHVFSLTETCSTPKGRPSEELSQT